MSIAFALTWPAPSLADVQMPWPGLLYPQLLPVDGMFRVDASNIVIRGAGSTQTTIHFVQPGNKMYAPGKCLIVALWPGPQRVSVGALPSVVGSVSFGKGGYSAERLSWQH
jgi:hypothetical protein